MATSDGRRPNWIAKAVEIFIAWHKIPSCGWEADMRFPAIAHLLVIIVFSATVVSAQDVIAGNLTIYAATSLTDAFDALAHAYEQSHPDVAIRLNFANSATLAAQIAAGAPADVFASANEFQMAAVIENGRAAEEQVVIFAHNRLIVIVPADNPADIRSVGDLAVDGVLLVLAASGTPIRGYTDAMLASHKAEYGDDFSERVRRNLVSEERNVRQVVARVALGEADAGVVYQSDARGAVASQLGVIPIDARHNQLASYPIAPLSDAAAPGLAHAFIKYLGSAEALRILADYGFCAPAILDEAETPEARPEPTIEPTEAGAPPEINCDAATSEDG